MEEKHAKALVEASEGTEHELTLHAGYSGRGMYGKTTWGVTGGHNSLAMATAIAARDHFEDLADCEEFIDAIGVLMMDNMGMDWIWY